MPALCRGSNWAGRSQERRADGRAGGAGRLRPVASFRFGRVWNAGPLELELALQADRLVGGADAFLVIDDTTLPKKGTHWVGVAPGCARPWRGQAENCQTLVSLTLAGGEVPVMVGLRLFLPESWTNDAVDLSGARRRAVGISSGAGQAGDCARRTRSTDRGRRWFWGGPRRRGLWHECARFARL